MKTIGEIIHHKNSPLRIHDVTGNIIYCEEFDRFWWKRQFNSKNTLIYLEYSTGQIIDSRP